MSAPVDRCGPSDSCGAAVGLPSCSSPTPHFGGGAGTIMSYCHQQPGDYQNIVSIMSNHCATTQRVPHVAASKHCRQGDRMPQQCTVTVRLCTSTHDSLTIHPTAPTLGILQAMTFGDRHTCGVAPNRVPQVMRAHVQEMAARYPTCLASGVNPPVNSKRSACTCARLHRYA